LAAPDRSQTRACHASLCLRAASIAAFAIAKIENVNETAVFKYSNQQNQIGNILIQ
jgi:hypothetical protein